MSTKAPDSGRFDQVVSAVTWNSTIRPLPRLTAVTSGVPSASTAQIRLGRSPSGSASTWRVTVTSLGDGEAGERPGGGEGAERLRLLPGKRAAERAPAAAKRHRHELVGGGGEARAGEAHQDAARLDPAGELGLAVAEIADVGEHDDRQLGRR